MSRERQEVGSIDREDALKWLKLALLGLYLANVFLHAAVFSSRNPIKRPSQQHRLMMISRLLFGIPVNIFLGLWLTSWIVFWELLRRPCGNQGLSPTHVNRRPALRCVAVVFALGIT